MIAVSPDENKKDKQVCNYAQAYYRSKDVVSENKVIKKVCERDMIIPY